MKKQFELSDGDVRFWLEQESLHLIAVDSYGDPIELSKDEAIELGKALLKFAEEIHD
jgi:hypothetical protein